LKTLTSIFKKCQTNIIQLYRHQIETHVYFDSRSDLITVAYCCYSNEALKELACGRLLIRYGAFLLHGDQFSVDGFPTFTQHCRC